MTLGIFEYREFLELAILCYETLLIAYEFTKHKYKWLNVVSGVIIVVCAMDIVYFMIVRKPMSTTVFGQSTYALFIAIFVLLLVVYGVVIYRNNKPERKDIETKTLDASKTETQEIKVEHAEKETEQDN